MFEGLSDNLLPLGQVPHIGDERVAYQSANGICKYVSPHGSYRYVYMVDGRPVSGLQVVSRDKKNAVVAQVYTDQASRRNGYATALLNQARKEFKTVAPATDFSKEGRAWHQSVFPSDLLPGDQGK